MDLDPQRLLVLATIAESATLTEAAGRLGHTPSAVSQQLTKLERQTGLALVSRAAGRLELTPAGLTLARAGARIQASVADAERDLAVLTGAVTGHIAIGTAPGGTVPWAAAAVPLLMERHPGLVPRVLETDFDAGLAMIRGGLLDVLVITDDRDTAVPVPPGCAARVLAEDEYRIVIPDSWKRPSDAAELSDRPWITAPPTSARQRCFRRFADQHRITPSVEHLAANPYALEAMAAAGLGAAVAPWFYANWLANCATLDLPVPGPSSPALSTARPRPPKPPSPRSTTSPCSARSNSSTAASTNATSSFGGLKIPSRTRDGPP